MIKIVLRGSMVKRGRVSRVSNRAKDLEARLKPRKTCGLMRRGGGAENKKKRSKTPEFKGSVSWTTRTARALRWMLGIRETLIGEVH